MKKLSEYVAKDIEGYEGSYAVTQCGKVYSHSKIVATGRLQKGRWLKLDKGRSGYLRATLWRDGKSYKYSVHRLVAFAFCEGYSEGLDVNHLDKVRDNNHYSNLEWCTRQENIEHALAETHTFIKPDGTSVEVYNLRKWCRDNEGAPSYGSLQLLSSGKLVSCKGWTLKK